MENRPSLGFEAQLRAARFKRITDEQKLLRKSVVTSLVDLCDSAFDLVIAVRDFSVALTKWITFEVKT